MASNLLYPTAVCKFANRKSGSSFIAVANTERISSRISSSVISDDRRTLPINPFRISILRISRPLGILISPFLLLLDFGRQIMSRLFYQRLYVLFGAVTTLQSLLQKSSRQDSPTCEQKKTTIS